jgi:glycosyltransferase involved in cell wall biosynthesis
MLNELSTDVKVFSFSNNKFLIFLIWKINAILLKLGFKYSFREWLNRKKFRKVIRKFNIDIVNTHMSSADLIAAEELEDRSVKFIPTMHGEYELNKKSGVKMTEEKTHKVLSRADGIIYTTQKNYDAIEEELRNYSIPIKKIHIGVPDNFQNIKPIAKNEIGIPDNAFVIGMVSRGIPEKGWVEAIEAFLYIKKKYTQQRLCLLLIGNGSYLKKLVDEYEDKSIYLLQFEKNPLDYISFIQLFDIGLLPSYFSGESVPNAIIEYLYFGKPVIGTAIGEIPEMISSNGKIAGTLIPFYKNKADIKKMEEAISEFIDSPDKYCEASALTKEAFKKFRIENCVNEYLKLFNEVLSCRQG